jgi:uncharacterized protein (TIGR03435 family)
MQYRAMQIIDFLRLLSVMGIDGPVLDRTGLTGHFDLQLQYDKSVDPDWNVAADIRVA